MQSNLNLFLKIVLASFIIKVHTQTLKEVPNLYFGTISYMQID